MKLGVLKELSLGFGVGFRPFFVADLCRGLHYVGACIRVPCYGNCHVKSLPNFAASFMQGQTFEHLVYLCHRQTPKAFMFGPAVSLGMLLIKVYY